MSGGEYTFTYSCAGMTDESRRRFESDARERIAALSPESTVKFAYTDRPGFLRRWWSNPWNRGYVFGLALGVLVPNVVRAVQGVLS